MPDSIGLTSIGDAARQPRRHIQPEIDLAQCQHTGIRRQAAPIETALNGLARNGGQAGQQRRILSYGGCSVIGLGGFVFGD